MQFASKQKRALRIEKTNNKKQNGKSNLKDDNKMETIVQFYNLKQRIIRKMDGNKSLKWAW